MPLPHSASTQPLTIAIIGAGFSGTAVAIQLLKRAERPLHLVMINRSGQLAKGLAYGTNSPHHLLNVPAGRMSVFPDAPDDFLAYLNTHAEAWCQHDFVPRSVYGDYLAHRLEQAKQHAPHISVTQYQGEASDIIPEETGLLHVTLSDGEVIEVDRVVLALGNYAPGTPAPLRPLVGDRSYINDPWAPHALAAITPDQPVLLLGNGLTMYDVALELSRLGHRGPLYSLSRRGLVPHGHRPHYHPPHSAPTLPPLLQATRLRDYVRLLRKHCAALDAQQIDWREGVAAIRPITPQLWMQLSIPDRARFLRHLQPYWDTHRHRCAPAIEQAIQALIAEQRLTVRAGRIISVHRNSAADQRTPSLQVTMRGRGAEQCDTLTVGSIVNCTGPAAQVAHIDDALLHQLLRRGLAQTDALGLGFLTDTHYGLQGKANDRLFYVGPLLKGQWWEATAVPELREHAARLVDALLNSALGLGPRHVSVTQNSATIAGEQNLSAHGVVMTPQI